jgi:hypothetical protein
MADPSIAAGLQAFASQMRPYQEPDYAGAFQSEMDRQARAESEQADRDMRMGIENQKYKMKENTAFAKYALEYGWADAKGTDEEKALFRRQWGRWWRDEIPNMPVTPEHADKMKKDGDGKKENWWDAWKKRPESQIADKSLRTGHEAALIKKYIEEPLRLYDETPKEGPTALQNEQFSGAYPQAPTGNSQLPINNIANADGFYGATPFPNSLNSINKR